MKDILKPFFTWLFGLFNIGLYNLSDDMDSVIQHLKFLGLQKQADELVMLYQQVERQGAIIIMIDSFKCLLMLMSLFLLIVINFKEIKAAFCSFYNLIKKIYSFFKNKLKKP